MKAIIPAAGFGTRFLPIAKAIPKEMLPVGDRPVIHYVVEEAVAAGFREILIVISRGKEAIRDYFSPNPELEARLEKAGKREALASVRAVSRLAQIEYVYQPEMRGLGDAVCLGRDFVGEDPHFGVLLGDTLISGGSALSLMRERGSSFGGAVALEACPRERVSRYGIAGGVEMQQRGVFRLTSVVEKPCPNEAPELQAAEGASLGPHAFAARYFFSREIFDILENTPPGLNAEIQLTDAMENLRASRGLLGVLTPGRRLDVGNPQGLLEAMQALAG